MKHVSCELYDEYIIRIGYDDVKYMCSTGQEIYDALEDRDIQYQLEEVFTGFNTATWLKMDIALLQGMYYNQFRDLSDEEKQTVIEFLYFFQNTYRISYSSPISAWLTGLTKTTYPPIVWAIREYANKILLNIKKSWYKVKKYPKKRKPTLSP